jgi:transposase-like protein/predicted DNA-binding protein (UPF0251 family)
MSRLKDLNLTNNKMKIERNELKEICNSFSKDFTATQTASRLNISRQTINNYFKIFRELLFNKIIIEKNIFTNLSISYIRVNQEYFYYIENDFILLSPDNPFFSQLNNFIKKHLHKILIRNKKINKVKLIYTQHKKDYLIMGYYNSSKDLENFINKRLKKFRGLNKENIYIYIQESIFRFKNDEKILNNKLIEIFNL